MFARPAYVRPPVSAPKKLERPVNAARCDGAGAPVQPKAVAAKPGKRAPTVMERAWMDKIAQYGCIACRIDGHGYRPPAVHHILRGGLRIGHMFTLPLCDPGHHQAGQSIGLISRHPWKARFEAKYGTELELLERLKTELR